MTDYLKIIIKKILRYQARIILKKYKPKVVAVIGSVGKSLTKEAIYTVISKKFHVRKSEKSFTNELGIPLTIIGSPYGMSSWIDILQACFFALKISLIRSTYPEWLILEVDSDKPGDLQNLTSWLAVDILVVTAIGEVPSHIELFGNMDKFLEEKKSFLASTKRDGVIIYNMDDSVTSNIALASNNRKVSCGLGSGGDYFGSDAEIIYGKENNRSIPVGMAFDITRGVVSHNIAIMETLGIQNIYACLLAFAVGSELGIAESKITQNLTKFKALPGRMRVLPGIKNSLLIDDSYNSSPIAMSQALSVFKELKTKGKKFVVVGDMMELGKFSGDEHRKVAQDIKLTADKVMCVGLRARKIAEELLSLGFSESDLYTFDDSVSAGKDLQNILEENDLVLVKGSQAVRMEKVVEEVMRHPEDREELLVRQEEEWVGRE
jgi:UDP-N-acetylmuramoyl-tripeptide--D-alanyl-D-alanine ligase